MVTRRAGVDIDRHPQFKGKLDLLPHAFLLKCFRGLGVFFPKDVRGVVQADLANARQLRLVSADEGQHRGQVLEACMFRVEAQGLV